jgi:uncharacterized SAM-binding protein YcdF (DUF218 family)
MPTANEALPALVLPLGLTLLLLLLALLTRRRWPALLAFTLLYASSTPLVARALMRAVVGDQIHGTVAAGIAADADAIVVLSSRRPLAPSADGTEVSEWTVADRFLAGIPLARADAAPWLVFTGGWSPTAPTAPLEGDANRDDAIALGVERERILTTGPVRNTAEEAVAVATLLRETLELSGEAPHVLLVTSAFHLPRAVALFERQGLRVTPYPVDLRVDAARILTLHDLLPSARALLDAETALREWLGRAVYRVGW